VGLPLGDARRHSFEAASFDVATASYLLHVVTPEARAEILGESGAC
jgi:ubiquinone/menaquinone biosynthesis C-methylase UbiE